MLLLSRVRALHVSAAAPRASLHCSNARAFHSLGLDEELVRRLAERGVVEPTAAQQQAIPAILRREDVVIAAETGGGKTLAYLLPLLEQLRTHPLAAKDTHRPVALILTTSQELVRQVASVLATLQPELAKHAVSLSSTNQSLRSQRACPVVIATPKALLRASTPKDFAFTRAIVVDEADMLLGGGFERDTKQILATIRNQPLLRAHLNDVAHAQQKSALAGAANSSSDSDDDDDEVIDRSDVSSELRQTIFSAISSSDHATIPDYGKRSVRQYIDYKFPNAHFAVTEDFQRTLPRLAMRFHDLDDLTDAPLTDAIALTDARNALLWDVLTDVRETPVNTLVFANSVASADTLFEYLDEQVSATRGTGASAGDIDSSTGNGATRAFPGRVLRFHKDVDRQERARVLAQLADTHAHVVVVCTDIAARGLDTTTVRHVVQYEFANDVVSHLHRIGRTARAGTTGRVTNIVTRANALVLEKIRAAGAASLDGAFSRKRSLRKKAKKLQRAPSDAF